MTKTSRRRRTNERQRLAKFTIPEGTEAHVCQAGGTWSPYKTTRRLEFDRGSYAEPNLVFVQGAFELAVDESRVIRRADQLKDRTITPPNAAPAPRSNRSPNRPPKGRALDRHSEGQS